MTKNLTHTQHRENLSQIDASTVYKLQERTLNEIRTWRIGCEDLIYRLSKQEHVVAKYEVSSAAEGKVEDYGKTFLEEMRKMEGMARERNGQLCKLRSVVEDMP